MVVTTPMASVSVKRSVLTNGVSDLTKSDIGLRGPSPPRQIIYETYKKSPRFFRFSTKEIYGVSLAKCLTSMLRF